MRFFGAVFANRRRAYLISVVLYKEYRIIGFEFNLFLGVILE